MDVTSWNLHHGSYLLEVTSWTLLKRTLTMKVTSWNLHHGSYLVEHTPWKLPHGTSPWKLPHGTYTMEVT